MKEIEEVLTRSGKTAKATRAGVSARILARAAVDAVLEKKARDVVVMDMHAVSGVADLFILCSGESDLQVKAIADSVREHIRELHGERPWHTEGYDHKLWILLDYVDVVVHVFAPDRREFYGLERLWGDAVKEEVPDTGSGDTVGILMDSVPETGASSK